MSICGSYAFSGSSFSDGKKQILSAFSIQTMPSALKNIPNFKICKNPSVKTAKFQNIQKSKILNPALGVHYSGCSVVPSAEANFHFRGPRLF